MKPAVGTLRVAVTARTWGPVKVTTRWIALATISLSLPATREMTPMRSMMPGTDAVTTPLASTV
jgi:hypothetical protein